MSVELPRVRHVKAAIPKHKKSIAFLSSANASDIDRAIIFVHGFGGSARSTWTDFISLVDDNNTSCWWETGDIYFLNYWWDSMFQKIPHNTNTLWKFLKYLFPEPPQELFEAAKISLRSAFRYKHLTLVGHSEGGLLIRKVILNAAQEDETLQQYQRERIHDPRNEPPPQGMLLAQLRLFAPAIGGEELTGIYGVVANAPIVGQFVRAIPAKKSMEPTSTSVTTARNYTDQYAGYLAMECFRAHILWADTDAIVSGEGYLLDRSCENLPKGTNHRSICKPNEGYRVPLKFVENGVVDGKCG